MEHHVYFWIKEELKTEGNKKAFEKSLAKLIEIEGSISAKWAIPAAVENRPVVDNSWDYAISIIFESVKAHDAYQDHPDHHVFIEENRHLWERVLVTDLDPQPN